MKAILGSACIALLLLSGCGEKTEETEGKVEVKKEVKQKVEEVKTVNVEPIQESETKTAIKEMATDLKESTSKAIDKAAVIAENISEKSSVIAEDLSKKSSQMLTKVTAKTEVISDQVIKKVKVMKKSLDKKYSEVVNASSENGKKLYLKCAGCHGQNGEKKALGKSAVIQGWDKDKTNEVLKGYKDGTYGAAMKAVMISQVRALSDENIEDLAIFISTL